MTSTIATIALAAFVLFAPLAARSAAKSAEERLAELEEQLLTHELEASAEKKLRLSGRLLNHVEALNLERTKVSPGEDIEHHANGLLAATHFQLNVDFELSRQLAVLSTLAMGKIWNNDGRQGIVDSGYRSNQGSYGLTGSDLKVDTAYLRWTSADAGWAFALGRMTTHGGAPMHQLDGLNREGTYPRFGYNMILDGVAVVKDLSTALPAGQSLKFRFFYTPHFFVDSNDRTLRATDTNGNEVQRRADLVALLSEYNHRSLSWAKEFTAYVMLHHYNRFADLSYEDSAATAPSYFQGEVATVYFGADDVARSGLNYSLSYLGFRERTTQRRRVDAHSFLHHLNVRSGERTTLGLEYIKTHPNFYIEDYAYLQFNGFYNRANSEGLHPFVSYQLDLYQRLRLGLYRYRAGKAPLYGLNYRENASNVYLSYRLDF